MNSEKSIKKYNQIARQYEQKWKDYLRHTHEMFLQRILTGPGEVILDASGGTGLLAQELISSQYPFGRLIVNDPSEEMLKVARGRLNGDTRISYTGYRAHELPFEFGRIDRILCLNSFHFYHQQQQALKRFHELLKPRGRVYLLDWDRSGFFRFVNRIIKWNVAEYIDTRSLPELIQMAEETGFGIASSESWNWRYWKFFFLEIGK